MKAMVVEHAGGAFQLVERPLPEPGSDAVRIRVVACGVCRGDGAVKEGESFVPVTYPRVPGHEVIGTIDAIGADVTGFAPGERVGVGWPAGITYDGGYAEYMVARADDLVRIPDALNAVEAAPLLCAGVTTYDALRHSGARWGDVVAVLGIGGLGHLAIQYARKMGFFPVAISRGEGKRELAEELGAQAYIDLERGGAAEELQRLGGARVILATAPDSRAISQLVNGLGGDGKLLLVAGVNAPIQVFGGQLLHGRRSIQGWVAGTPNARQDTVRFSLLTDIRARVETFPLASAQTAYDRMMGAAVRFRAVLTPNQG